MIPISWSEDRTFSVQDGTEIRMLQRAIPLESAAVAEELEPFCCLPCLLQISRKKENKLLKGMVGDFLFNVGCLDLGFRTDDESGILARFHIEKIKEIRLTVWRVNDKLDAIQLNIHAPGDWLYLQTGGEALLDRILLNMQQDNLAIARDFFLANTRPT